MKGRITLIDGLTPDEVYEASLALDLPAGVSMRWDRSLRLWRVALETVEGYQIGDVIYATTRVWATREAAALRQEHGL